MRWWLLLGLTACTPALDPTDVDSDSDPVHTDTDMDTDTDTGQVEDPVERVVIYQLVVRHFSNTVTTRTVDGTLQDNGVGKFDDIDDNAIEGLKELGVTHVWLTGIPRQATLTDWSDIGLPPDDPDVVKGRAGSFYAVRDYFDTSPDYATDPERRLQELQALIDRLHDADLKVLVDLVPNHVARGYESTVRPDLDFGRDDDPSVFFDPDNHFFYLVDPPGQALELSRPQGWNPPGVSFDGRYGPEDGSTPARTPKVTGNDVTSPRPSANDWYETVKLNWGYDFTRDQGEYDPVPATWTTMDAVVAYWQDLGVDGFRADFAHLVPDPAWTWLLERARERDPDAWFVAEAYANLQGLQDAGFDAVYHDAAYDTLKRLYQGRASQADVDGVYLGLSDERRHRWLHYLENHDERRIASPLIPEGAEDGSGFGSAGAGRQLAPVQYLISNGPILIYNGQEVGETGAGREGFGGDDGRTTIFDYWSLPALQGWVNGHRYDGGGLTPEQAELRAWYSELLSGPVHDPAARGSGFWGLEYVNNSSANPGFPDDLFTFARFRPGAGRLLVVVANFRPGASTQGSVRLPADLLGVAGIGEQAQVRRIFDHTGAVDGGATPTSRFGLTDGGILVEVADQAAVVVEVVAE